MGGLASALTLARNGFRRIDVFESASSLGFVGAGIQLAPNMARILDRLGVWTELEREAVTITDTSIRRKSSAIPFLASLRTARGINRRGAGQSRSLICRSPLWLSTYGWSQIQSCIKPL